MVLSWVLYDGSCATEHSRPKQAERQQLVANADLERFKLSSCSQARSLFWSLQINILFVFTWGS